MPEAAALEAALRGASRALVRRIAKQDPEAAAQEAAYPDTDRAPCGAGDAAGARAARSVATAVPDARVRDLAEHGRLDVLVNNAGAGSQNSEGYSRPFWEQPVWRWHVAFGTGVRALRRQQGRRH